jgi:hypothetical protein
MLTGSLQKITGKPYITQDVLIFYRNILFYTGKNYILQEGKGAFKETKSTKSLLRILSRRCAIASCKTLLLQQKIRGSSFAEIGFAICSSLRLGDLYVKITPLSEL